MTYYEEFGIPSSATPEQIRIAHRRLMKILHPDLQIEDRTRQLAEIQSCRINGMAETLLDFERRKIYDASLLPLSGQRPRVNSSYSRIALAAVVLLVLIELGIVQAERSQMNPPSIQESQLSIVPATAIRSTSRSSTALTKNGAVAPIANPKISIGPPSFEVPAMKPTNVELQVVKVETSRSLPENIGLRPVVEATHRVAVQEPSTEVLANVTESPLAGTWIYVPASAAEEDRVMYRPEYIELRIRTIRGVLEGQYRARYHVPDRPLSPSVGFHFAGQAGNSPAAFRWSGSNGIAGQVDLKLMTANSIQVDWRVTELAETADLISGTAILTRVQ